MTTPTRIPARMLHRLSIPVGHRPLIKCECDAYYCPYYFTDCPICSEIEMEEWLNERDVRRALADAFRACTPPYR